MLGILNLTPKTLRMLTFDSSNMQLRTHPPESKTCVHQSNFWHQQDMQAMQLLLFQDSLSYSFFTYSKICFPQSLKFLLLHSCPRPRMSCRRADRRNPQRSTEYSSLRPRSCVLWRERGLWMRSCRCVSHVRFTACVQIFVSVFVCACYIHTCMGSEDGDMCVCLVSSSKISVNDDIRPGTILWLSPCVCMKIIAHLYSFVLRHISILYHITNDSD
jgi:hypothetical protein